MKILRRRFRRGTRGRWFRWKEMRERRESFKKFSHGSGSRPKILDRKFSGGSLTAENVLDGVPAIKALRTSRVRGEKTIILTKFRAIIIEIDTVACAKLSEG